MIKSFLILMLATTQLLTGSGGSVYLCIKSDGTFCCLETGAQTGRCCQDEMPVVDEEPSECACCREAASPSLPIEEPAPISSFEPTLASNDACGCTHVLIARDPAHAKLTRLSALSDVQQWAAIAVDLPGLIVADRLHELRFKAGGEYRPPAVESQTLILRSAVQIRC